MLQSLINIWRKRKWLRDDGLEPPSGFILILLAYFLLVPLLRNENWQQKSSTVQLTHSAETLRRDHYYTPVTTTYKQRYFVTTPEVSTERAIKIVLKRPIYLHFCDDMDAFELLPPELWVKIFERVEDAQDWLNLVRTSTCFEDLVGDKKCQALFQKVFPHIRKELWEEGDLESVLTLRLVCRRWSSAADKDIEALMLVDEPSYWPISKLKRKYELREVDGMSRFLDTFSTHHSRNPFIGRYLALDHPHPSSFEHTKQILEYIDLASRIMTNFGHQLRVLHIFKYLFQTLFFDIHWYQLGIRREVQQAPELESLHVTIGIPHYLQKPHRAWTVIVYPFQEDSERSPMFQNLKSLVFHQFRNCDQLLFEDGRLLEMQNEIVRTTCNPDTLKKIKCYGVPSGLLKLPNLEEAVLLSYREEDCSELAKAEWPAISKLTLDSSWSSTCLVKMIKSVGRFGDTLTKLRVLSYWRSRRVSIQRFERLKFAVHLPILKHLDVDGAEVSFDSIMSLPSLQEIYFSGYEYRNSEEFLKAVEEEVGRTRIWEVLPQLKKIEGRGPEGSVLLLRRR